MRPIGSQPAWITYETEDKKRHEKRATAEDIRRALQFQRDAITDWFPTTAMGPEREMFIRCALHLQGVKSVADFYTARNLRALAAIWREILLVPDVRVRRVLAFAFTNTAWHGTRMRRFNARGGQRPLTGTLYIPQLSSEVNVLSVMRHKIKQLGRYYRDYQPRAKELPAVVLGSASDLAGVATGSVDYVFTDPPFGSNIFYADCNLIWESWLGRLTSTDKEAVVNRSLSNGNGGKTLEFYGRVMGAAMLEMARVLKPGGWATIVFHNTDAAVWKSIRDAAIAAGFEFHEASSLNRKQHSHKGYKGRAGAEDVAHFDVVFNLRRSRKSDRVLASSSNNDERDLKAFVASIAREKLIVARGLQGLHSEVMRRLASSGSARFVDYAVVRSVWEELIGKSKPVAAAID
jgi:hypothetical protein